MKYIDYVTPSIGHKNYFAYLETVRNELGEELYAFASDVTRHDLSSRSSLHDAWIQSLNVRSFYIEKGRDPETPDITLILLGPYHDRTHTLTYYNVKRSHIDFEFCKDGRKRDLLQHEIRIEDGILVHEFAFSGDMKIEICCERIQHSEKLFDPA